MKAGDNGDIAHKGESTPNGEIAKKHYGQGGDLNLNDIKGDYNRYLHIIKLK